MDTLTMMDYECGKLNEKQTIEMLAELLETGFIDNVDNKYKRLAKYYIKGGYLDNEGNINFIKLKSEFGE